MKISNLQISKIYEVFLVIILKLIFEYAYYLISIRINISNLYKINFNLIDYILGWILALGIYMILLYKKDLRIFTIFVFLYFLYILPNIVYFSYTNISIKYLFYLLIPYILILVFTKNYDINKLVKIKISPKYILLFSFIIIIVVLIHIIYVTKGNFVVDIREVYDFREKFSDLTNKGIFGYINNWVFKVFMVFVFSWALLKKNYYMMLFSISIFLIFYLFTGYKSIFLSMFLVIFIYIIYRFNWNRIIILFGIIMFFFSIILIHLLTRDIWIMSFLIRRLVFLPSVLNFAYFDFFSFIDSIYWSNGILKSFFTYPFNKEVSLLMGDYLKISGNSLNIGFIPMAFVHAKLLGIVLYTLIATIILNIINNFIFNEEEKFIKISLAFLSVFTFFISSDLSTTLLTHGLFIIIIVIITLNIQNNKIEFRKK